MSGNLFDKITNIEQLKEYLLNTIPNINCFYFPENNLRIVLDILNNASEKTAKRIIRAIHHLDKSMKFKSENDNIGKKVQTLLAMIIYLGRYQDETSNYSRRALELLSFRSIIEPLPFYGKIRSLYDYDLVEELIKKEDKFMLQENLLDVIPQKKNEGFSNIEILEYIQKTDPTTLHSEINAGSIETVNDAAMDLSEKGYNI